MFVQNNRKLVWMYNVIIKLEGVMHNNNNPPYRRTNFLSEYESHESESQSNRGRHIRTSRIMRKLKELWHRQRYLTDDQIESGREGQFETEREEAQSHWNKPANKGEKGGEEEKRLHARHESSEQQRLNVMRKKNSRQSGQSQQPSKESKDMQQLQQIAAFNSQVQNESK